MKFILEEDVTLEEKELLEAPLNRVGPGEKRARQRANQQNTDEQQYDTLTQEEEGQLSKLLKDNGYSNEKIEDTLEMVRKDENKSQEWRKVIDKFEETGRLEKSTPSQQQTNNDASDASNQEDVTNEQQPNEQPTNEKQKDRSLQQLQDVSPKAYEILKQAAGDNLYRSDFPFNRLMNMPAFTQAVGMRIKESLDEASTTDVLNGVTGGLGNIGAGFKKARQAYRGISVTAQKNLLRAYNAVINFKDENLVNDYITKAGNHSVLCDKSFYNLKDDTQMKRALNMDIAITMNNRGKADEEEYKRNKAELLDAIKSNKVDQLSTYDLKGGERGSTEENYKAIEKAWNNLPRNAKENVLKELTKSMKGN